MLLLAFLPNVRVHARGVFECLSDMRVEFRLVVWFVVGDSWVVVVMVIVVAKTVNSGDGMVAE
jgi:hypothetical protein